MTDTKSRILDSIAQTIGPVDPISCTRLQNEMLAILRKDFMKRETHQRNAVMALAGTLGQVICAATNSRENAGFLAQVIMTSLPSYVRDTWDGMREQGEDASAVRQKRQN